VILGVAAVLLAVLCLVAGRWQWDRYEDRAAQIELIEANWSAEPVPAADVLAGPGDVLREDAVWRPVTLTGRYEPGATVLLRNRPVHSTPGFHVLVPFVAEHPGAPDGIVLVIDRGFGFCIHKSLVYAAARPRDVPPGTSNSACERSRRADSANSGGSSAAHPLQSHPAIHTPYFAVFPAAVELPMR
jgi:cytochrome oxidase assembly protein ShyY1